MDTVLEFVFGLLRYLFIPPRPGTKPFGRWLLVWLLVFILFAGAWTLWRIVSSIIVGGLIVIVGLMVLAAVVNN